MKKIIVAALLLFSMNAAMAQLQSHAGKITGYISSQSGSNKLFYFKLEANPSGGCNTTTRFAVSSTSPLFEGAQATVMAAYHSDTQVRVYYEDTCTSAPNAWDTLWVCVGDIPC